MIDNVCACQCHRGITSNSLNGYLEAGLYSTLRDLSTLHLWRLMYHITRAAPVSTVRLLSPMRLRSSCSGSLHQVKNVTTSLAIWLSVAGVPARCEPMGDKGPR